MTDRYVLYHGDVVDLIKSIPDRSIHYSIFSPPFASLFVYSNSPRDMGNCSSQEEFLEHYSYLAGELLRITKPGRLCSVHNMLLPTSLAHDGVIGLKDFRGDIIRSMQSAGWIFHSEVCIWKDPVTAMQRTKALGLLYKQIRKDSAMSRQGIPDYLCTFADPSYLSTFRANGRNEEPISHTPESFPLPIWQRYASPIWMDIDQSDTLNAREAREEQDERHLCPLQLEVIRRGVLLWSNPGDTVFSPFAGIGSEGYVSLQEGRRFVGVELKRSYYESALRNLGSVSEQRQGELFGG